MSDEAVKAVIALLSSSLKDTRRV